MWCSTLVHYAPYRSFVPSDGSVLSELELAVLIASIQRKECSLFEVLSCLVSNAALCQIHHI
jgi:hypothetical protein